MHDARMILTVGLLGLCSAIGVLALAPPSIRIDAHAGSVAASHSPATVYWTDLATQKIQTSSLDGGGLRDLIVIEAAMPAGLAIDGEAGRLYWGVGTPSLSSRGMIQSAGLDGTSVQNVLDEVIVTPSDIALDLDNRRLYWSDYLGGGVHRAGLDGSEVESIVADVEPLGLALDLANGKVYWTAWSERRIQRANLDGSQVEDVVTLTEPAMPRGIAIDTANAKLYWTDNGTDSIWRIDLNDGSREALVGFDAGGPGGIALDLEDGKMYWTADGHRSTGPELETGGRIRRASLDGTNVEDLATGLAQPYDIALGPAAPDTGVTPEPTGMTSSGETPGVLPPLGSGGSLGNGAEPTWFKAALIALSFLALGAVALGMKLQRFAR